ncbi:MAG: cell wall-binding repeat-containing protein [Acidimicrobiia bacterium]
MAVFTRARVHLIAFLALALVAGLLTSPVDAESSTPRLSINRVSGSNRVETAVSVSNTFFPAASTVILATADNYADALAAGPLARKLNAPILLSPANALPTSVSSEIERLGASKVVIIGGTKALSAELETALSTRSLHVTRLSGDDRFATAGAVANEVIDRGGDVTVSLGWGPQGFADALSAATLGMKGDTLATLLTQSNGLPAATVASLVNLQPTNAVVMGGAEAVNASVYSQIAARSNATARVQGATRYATAVAAARIMENGSSAPSTLIVARGDSYPDSVVAGALTQRLGAPLLLVPSKVADGGGSAANRLAAQVPELVQYLKDHCETTDQVVILGGESAINPSVEAAIKALLSCDEEADDPDGTPPGGGDNGGGGSTPPTTTTSTTSTTVPTTTSTTVPTTDPGDGDGDGTGDGDGGNSDYEPPTGFSGLGVPVPGQVTHPADIATSWTTGENRGQNSVENDALDERRVALVSGKVFGRQAFSNETTELGGVTVTVAGEADLGYTTTTDEGEYLIALNGGSEVVLEFRLDEEGYLPVQRRFHLGWGAWLALDDVVLTQRDPKSTLVDSTQGGYHKASPVVENDRTRTGRVYIHPGTVATMVGGTQNGQTLSKMTLSITEYTVGEAGPAAMPGDLPPSIEYTYASEVSVAEADAAGAHRVDLSIPASLYLDNFLQFPVGTRAPFAIYERDVAVWVPTLDGSVMKVLSQNGTSIEIDLGENRAATEEELIKAGFPSDETLRSAELAAVAELFSVGNEFWRVQMPHFSPGDINYPVTPTEGAVGPPTVEAEEQPFHGPINDETPQEGYGTVRVESGALVENLPIPGTPVSLVHTSDRLPGRFAEITIPIWGDSNPADMGEELIEAWAEVSIAGRTLTSERFSATELQPNMTATVVWDGRDRYGRLLVGSQTAHVSVVYAYQGYYKIPSATAARSFGVPPTGQPTTLVPSRLPTYLRSSALVPVTSASWDATGLGLGGWGVSLNHAYDPRTGLLHYGDGTSFRADLAGGEYQLVGGANPRDEECQPWIEYHEDTNHCGDGGLAVDAIFENIIAIDVGPDGSIYIADQSGFRIRRIDPNDGKVYPFAGKGGGTFDEVPAEECDTPDNTTGPCDALNAIFEASDLAVGRDGSVYIADLFTNRVRKVTSDGLIANYVGTGEACNYDEDETCGDGGPANQARLGARDAVDQNLSCPPLRIALAPDDSLFVTHGNEFRIRRVGSDGYIETALYADNLEGFYKLADDLQPCVHDSVIGSSASFNEGQLVRGPYQPGMSKLSSTQTSTGPSVRPADIDLLVRDDGTLVFSYGSPTNMNDTCDSQGGVWALAPGGAISWLAGSDKQSLCTEVSFDDGLASTEVPIAPYRLTKSPTGATLVSVRGYAGQNPGVRRIGNDGVISTVVPWWDDTAATAAFPEAGSRVLASVNHSVAPLISSLPDGTTLVAYSSTNNFNNNNPTRILAIAPPLPGFGSDELVVPDRGGKHLHVFNSRGLHLRTESAISGRTLYSFNYDPMNNALVSFTDFAGRLDGSQPGDGLVTTIERDGEGLATAIVGPYGHRTELVVDDAGWLASVEDPTAATITFETNEGGQLTKVTGAVPDTIYEFGYDDRGWLTSATRPESGTITYSQTTNGKKSTYTATRASDPTTTQVATVEALPGGGMKRTFTNEANLTVVSETQFDGSVKTTMPNGTVEVRTPGVDPRPGFGTIAAFAAESSLTTPGEENPVLTTVSRTADFDNDELVSFSETTARNGEETTSTFTVGNKTQVVTLPNEATLTTVYDNFGRVLSTSGTDMPTTSLEYDTQGRVTTVTETANGATERVWKYEWHDTTGHLVSITDPLGDKTTFATDAIGRITGVQNPDGTETAIAFDDAGRMESLTTPGNDAHSFAFNLEDQLSQYRFPEIADTGGTTNRSFTNGLLTGVQRPGEGATSFTHDAARRYSGRSGDSVLDSTLTYDNQGRVGSVHSDDEVTTTFDYDGFRLNDSALTIDSQNFGNVAYAFDSHGRINQETLGTDEISFSYTTGLLAEAGAMEFTYDLAGRVSKRTLGDLTVEHVYDGFGNLSETVAKHNEMPVFKEELERDLADRVTKRTETLGNEPATIWTYEYDDGGRLSRVSEDDTNRYFAYDENGNLICTSPEQDSNGEADCTAGASTSASYDARDRILERGEVTYTFNDAGDLVTMSPSSGSETQVEYDAAGLLREVRVGTEPATSYLHDGFDRRVGRQVGGNLETVWLYDQFGRIVAEYNNDESLVSRFVYGASGSTADYLVHKNENLLIVSDWRGSPRLVVAPDGTIKQRLNYDEWGAITNADVGNDIASGFAAIPFGFQGGLVDQSSGLVRFGARDYDPALGRFTTIDPILFNGGQTNLYQFAYGDPINYADPSGSGPAEPNTQINFVTGARAGAKASYGSVGASIGIISSGSKSGIQLSARWGKSAGTLVAGSVHGYAGVSTGDFKTGISSSTVTGGMAGAGTSGGATVSVNNLNGNVTATGDLGLGAGAAGHISEAVTMTLEIPTIEPLVNAGANLYAWGYSLSQ